MEMWLGYALLEGWAVVLSVSIALRLHIEWVKC